jgi:DnaK suppressor protein
LKERIVVVNVDHYRQRLLKLERELSTRLARESEHVRDQTADTARDSGDESLADLVSDTELAGVDLLSTRLRQVREALLRIDNGTFGRCVVDGEPIEPKRLEAMPWTPYCLKHEQQREEAERTPATM